MSNNIIDSMKIRQLYSQYQEKYGISLPILKDIKYINNSDCWARFLAPDLYSAKYVLYVDNDLLIKNNKFIKQSLYHEFTHLADSLRFLDKSLDDFKNIMNSYSEFHASKREMLERLEEIDDNNITLQSDITHIEILTINSFISQSFEFMKKDLQKMDQNKNIQDFFYNTNRIYYFYGYVSALKSHNIDWDIKTYELPPHFYKSIKSIENTLLSDNINVEKVVLQYLELEKSIKDKYILNQILKRG